MRVGNIWEHPRHGSEQNGTAWNAIPDLQQYVTESEKRELQMMLFKTMIAPAVICLTLSAATTLHAQERMRTGNWENTVILANGQTMTQNACLSAHDAAMSNGSPAVIRAETEKAIAKSGRCTLKDFNIDSKSKTETMVCGASTTHNETTFHGGDSFETTTTRTSGGGVTVAHFKGRRTGDCQPGEQ
jgi:hypothetical protein